MLRYLVFLILILFIIADIVGCFAVIGFNLVTALLVCCFDVLIILFCWCLRCVLVVRCVFLC